jgi:hypothetical protein
MSVCVTCVCECVVDFFGFIHGGTCSVTRPVRTALTIWFKGSFVVPSTVARLSVLYVASPHVCAYLRVCSLLSGFVCVKLCGSVCGTHFFLLPDFCAVWI